MPPVAAGATGPGARPWLDFFVWERGVTSKHPCALRSGALGASSPIVSSAKASRSRSPGGALCSSSGGRDAPGTLALWDETTGTLIAASLASIDRLPDLRGHRLA